MGVAPSHEVNSEMEGVSANIRLPTSPDAIVATAIPMDGRGVSSNVDMQAPVKCQQSLPTTPGPKAGLSQIRSFQKQRRKSQFNPHRLLASRDPGATLAAKNPCYSLNSHEGRSATQQRRGVSHADRVGFSSQRPTSLGALPTTTELPLNRRTSAHSVKSAPAEISTQQASDKHLITIGSSRVSIAEVKEAIDKIAAQNDGDSLPAPWDETQMKIAQYLSHANSKTTPLECPPRTQGVSTSADEIVCSHDDAYLERLYNLRTWNMYKLISEAREDDGYAPLLVYPNFSSPEVHRDDLAGESHDMIFDLD